jgi:hypothetical protein
MLLDVDENNYFEKRLSHMIGISTSEFPIIASIYILIILLIYK